MGDKLNAKTVLEGSVRAAGNRLRVNAQLINAEDGYHIWSERYDRTMDDVFDVQDEIAQAVVSALQLKLLPSDETSLVRHSTENMDAYRLYLEGRHHQLHLTRSGMEQAFACYEKALAHDPGYPDPHAGIALCYLGGILGWISPREAASKQKEAAQRALALSPSTPHAHYAFGHAVHCYDWDWALAEAEYRRELDVNPTNAEAQSVLAVLFSNLGKHDEAIREAERAVAADPLSPFIGHHLAMVLTIAGQHDASIRQARHDIELSPTFYLTHWDLGMALWAQGKTDDALAAFQASRSHAAGLPLIEGSVGWALGRAGHQDEARAIAGDLERRRETGHCTAPGSLDTHLSYAAGRSSYASRASIGV